MPTATKGQLTQVEFTAVQVIEGVTSDEYTANKASIDTGFASTVANSMGIAASGVTVDEVTPSSRRRLLESSSGLDFNYKVMFVVGVDNEFTSGSEGYEAAVNSIDSAIQDGSFTTALQASSDALSSAISNEIPNFSAPEQTVYVPPSGGGSDDDSLDSGAVAGIVVGVLIGSAIFGIGGFYWWREQKDKRMMATISSPEWRSGSAQDDTTNPIQGGVNL